MNTQLTTTISTNVLIKSGSEVLVDKANAIHPENMAIAIARGLSNAENHQIFKIKMGNQGTYVDSSAQIFFKPTITTGVNAELYNPTYVEIVDDTNTGVGIGNSVTFTGIPASTSKRVIITAVISPNEAVNRPTDLGDATSSNGLDGLSASPSEGQYFFDELGLFTSGVGNNQLNDTDELMLTHLIFSPIEHTGNRELTIVYSLTITVTGT